MKIKLLLISILTLAAVVFVSCSNVNISDNIENSSKVIITESAAGEGLPLSAQEKEDIKTVETVKTEDIFDTAEPAGEVENKADANKTNENITECLLSVRCDTILNNMDKLNKEKKSLVPKDGIIFPQTKVVFYAGESAFNVLSREFKKNKIHIDFVNTPMYNTVYIRGISNLYEHDCGELSGWIYKVNGEVPGYGCSQYLLNDGDKIEFLYTCNLGKDID